MIPQRPIILIRAVFRKHIKCFHTDGITLVGPALAIKKDKLIKENHIYISYLDIVHPDDSSGHLYREITKYRFSDVVDLQNGIASVVEDFVKVYDRVVETYPPDDRLHDIYKTFDFDYPTLEDAGLITRLEL